MGEIRETNIQRRLDNLADIIWFIKGWLQSEDGSCPFQADHVDTLRDVRIELQDEMNGGTRRKEKETEQVEKLKDFIGALAADLGLFDDETGDLKRDSELYQDHIKNYRYLVKEIPF